MDVSLLLPLIGIPVVVLGFALRFNPLLVVTAAGLATGLATGMSLTGLLETFGEKFPNSRQLATLILILPVSACWSATASRSGRRAGSPVSARPPRPAS